jgi:DNA-binding transcriptional regulator YdaS (Cro superfamily)
MMLSMSTKLQEWIQAKRGRGAALARAIDVHPVLVSQWALGDRPVPLDHCAAIEIATGGAVKREALRPLDWQRVWPELASRTIAPPVRRSKRSAAAAA